MLRATAYGAAGQFERALELMQEAEANVRDHDPRRDDLAIANGDLSLTLPSLDVTAAEARFDRAAVIAGSRRARMIELQALTRLVSVRSGDRQEDTLQRLRQLCVHADRVLSLHRRWWLRLSEPDRSPPRQRGVSGGVDACTMARRHRQQAEILATVGAGDLPRALALSREHLTEFPDDSVVRRVIVEQVWRSGDLALQAELRQLPA